jgi:hypothetical protein
VDHALEGIDLNLDMDSPVPFDDKPHVRNALFVPAPAAEKRRGNYPHSGEIPGRDTDDRLEESFGIANVLLVAKDGPDDVVVEGGNELLFPGLVFVFTAGHTTPPILYMGFTCRFALITGKKIEKKTNRRFMYPLCAFRAKFPAFHISGHFLKGQRKGCQAPFFR